MALVTHQLQIYPACLWVMQNKLSYIEDVGNVGMTELFDPPNILQDKIERLTRMIRKSKHLVVFTGAGISTSCGIPDFRGPTGIWTLQNIDGLHLRSGIPRDKLSELHGNSFMERCTSCGTEYFRDFEVESVGLKETSRK